MKNKFFCITLTFFIIISLFTSKIFASDKTTYPSFDNLDVSSYAGYSLDNYILIHTDTYYLLIFKTNFLGKVYYENKNISTSDHSPFIIYRYHNSNYEFYYEQKEGISKNNSGFIVSSINIYNKNDTVFFWQTQQVTITEVAKVKEITEIMTKTIKMIIPIGLLILSIGLLIYVIKLVILRAT